MTRGTWHVTDVSNASRTLLFDLEQRCVVRRAVRPLRRAPRRPARGGRQLGRARPAPTRGAFLDLDLPIAGIAGDQQSALFGQTCFDEGDSKCTYGTGSFILTNTGDDRGPLRRRAAVDRRLARPRRRTITYALEGAIFVTGAAVQWLRDGLQIVGTAAETAAIAGAVDSTDGVVFVPALTGLGAPHWDPHARGTILGITRGTTRAHLVRATLEAITFEVRDVDRARCPALTSLAVDGGAAANDLLCQLQADLLGVPVERPRIVETTALGAAFMAGLGTGVWDSTDDLRSSWQLDRHFDPDPARRRERRPRPTPCGRRASSGPRAGPEPSLIPGPAGSPGSARATRVPSAPRPARPRASSRTAAASSRATLAVLEILVDVVDVVLESGQPATQLVDLPLQLQPAGAQRPRACCRPRSSSAAVASRPLARPRRPRPARPRAGPGRPPGTRCSDGAERSATEAR